MFKPSQLNLHVKILNSFDSRDYIAASAWRARKRLILDVQSDWEAIKTVTCLGNFAA